MSPDRIKEPPDRRTNDQWKEYLEERLHRFFFRCLFVVAIIGVTSAIAILGFGIVLGKQKDNTRMIQKQRYDVQYGNCVAQNKRHDNAIRKARALFPEETRRVVILLVDELQPFVPDCVKLARSRVKG